MGLGTGLLKIIVFICNFIFFIVGGALVAVTVFLVVRTPDAIQELEGDIFTIVIWTFFSLGLFLFIMGFLGCCGTCKEDSCMLCSFIVLMTVLIAVEVCAAIYGGILLQRVSSDLENNMRDRVKNDYNETSSDPFSEAWDTIQREFECCGAVDYRDYNNSTFSATTGKSVPSSCCKSGSDNTLCLGEAETGDYVCTDREPFPPAEHLNPCGCYEPVSDWLSAFGTTVVALTIVVALCQAVLIIFSCCLKSNFSKVGAI